MTRVVNIQHDRCDIYIGRGGPFGNPYVIGENGDRAEVLRKYKIHFLERLKRDPAWKAKVEALKGKTLGCFCAYTDGFKGEFRCHGQIIAAYLDGIAPEAVE